MNTIIRILLFIVLFSGINESNAQNNDAVYSVNNLVDGEFLHDFMLVGPFPNPLPEGIKDYFHLDDVCLGYNKDYLKQVGGENGVQPFVGQVVKYGQGKSEKWIKYHSAIFKVDLKKVFTPNEGVVCYAAIWLNSEKDQVKVFGVGSNDGMKVWLNGKNILNIHVPRTVNIDDEYLKLDLKKGKNLLLIKIEQGYGGWGFVLRPVSKEDAWNHAKEKIDVALTSEFFVQDGKIKGTIGDKNIVGALTGLPLAKVKFNSINGKHSKTIEAPIGTFLELKKSDFPDLEYSVEISFNVDGEEYTTLAYLNTKGNVIEEYNILMNRELAQMPNSGMSTFYKNFHETTKWLHNANKLWGHPYGYRRYLDGLKNVHKLAKKLSESDNPYEGVFPAPREISISSKKTKVTSDWKIFDQEKSNDIIAVEIAKVWKNKFGKTPQYTKKSKSKKSISLIISNNDNLKQHEAGYSIEISKKKIIIESASRQGLYYGMNTLLQAISLNNHLPNGKIVDWPEYPYRSTILTKYPAKLTDEFKNYINLLVSLRYNIIYLPSNNYLDLDDPEKLKEITAVFDYCKSRYIEPVAYFETFGAGTITRVVDPCLDEGVFHEKELWQVPENGIIKLKAPRIHDCEGTTIHVFNEAGKELERDVDYQLLSTEKPQVEILAKELINKNVLLSYDAVDFSLFPHPASCPSDPRGWVIMEKVISDVITKLKPNALHISQDEAGFVNKDSRCLARGLTNQEIMIDQINRVYNLIRKYDKNIEICIWGDLFNDFHNAPKAGIVGCISGLPKDIVVHDWNYVAAYHHQKRQTEKQMNFYLDRGYRTGGVAWYEPANALDIVLTGNKKRDQFIGVMYSAWTGFEYSFYPVAELNWTGKTIMGMLEF